MEGSSAGGLYGGGVDLAGPSEVDLTNEARRRDVDRTVITIAEVDRDDLNLACARVVERIIWEGLPHSAQLSDRKGILDTLWHCQRVTVDSTGLGQPIAEFLVQALGDNRVEPYTLTSASKSELGSE